VRLITLALGLGAAAFAIVAPGGGQEAKAQQPTMVISGTSLGGKAGTGPLSKAMFNHQEHENAVGNCETCHHASMDGCSTCHTTAGSPEGNDIQLSQAMHDPRAPMSCVGCHQKETAKAQCQGCHRKIAPGPSNSSCAVCHKDPKAPSAQAPAMQAPDVADIGSLSAKYGVCSFNHASHVEMLKDAAKGALPQAFHAGGVFCQGCHHHTPAGVTPPKCGTCHSKSFQDQDPKRPGLEAAFHIQCNQCHKAMGVTSPAPTDCQACHAAKK
jgi:hypothetical protein